ncbi:hypothetical protein NECHADRAFT_88150 [Paecilomyces variotii No. 5]|uniref:Amine oxidase n=1 Tax=Byssochlamys spectabilis (strain No. 5 / NBRC 109023) TaxID=1356009 RepID=V5G3S4_BYSSN|nr:hypothetical protein NECHADRAFT_88150 [Paecilomyces variotii No. 5]
MSRTIKTVDLSHTSNAYYAPATISTGALVHIAGQPGSTKDGFVPDDYESQIHLALLNLRKVILSSGASIENIAKLTLLIVNYGSANRKHVRPVQRFLRGHRPAITLIPVSKLAVPSWLFEIDALVALPTQSPVSSPSLGITTPWSAPQRAIDVVIIGAGLAGLSAAHEIIRAGHSCIVLEARDRVGGKTWSQSISGSDAVVDVGAAWINDTNQSRVYALAKRYGAELIEQNTKGRVVLEDFEGFDEPTRQKLAEIRDMVEADCQEVDTWKPHSTSLDAVTFEAYLRSHGADDVSLATATVWTRAMLGQEPRDISALYFLNYCKSGGGLLQMRSDRKHGGQYLRIRQGTQLLAKGLAESLPEGVVHLSSPVQSVTQVSKDSIRVHSSSGVYTARKVVTTVPGPVLKTISFTPQLPIAKRAYIDSLSYGYYTKAMMEFTSPFWVEKGFCGLTQSFVGPASVVRDTSSPADKKYVLTCFLCGDPGRTWAALSTRDREVKLLQQLKSLFDYNKVEDDFVQMHTYEWVSDEFSGWGCPCTSLMPGVLDAVGADALREPFGDVHFAGTETAGEWKGYMEGAVRSGERAAGEVVGGLRAIVSKL